MGGSGGSGNFYDQPVDSKEFWFGGGGSDTNESSLQQASGYRKSQEKLMDKLAGQTKRQLGRYQGPLDELASGRPSTEVNEGLSREFVQRSIANPAMQRLREETLPMLNQRFGGGRGFWGSARMRQQGKDVQNTQNQISTQLGQVLYQDEQSRRALKESGLQRALQAQQFSPEERASRLLGMKPVDTVANPPVLTLWDQLGLGVMNDVFGGGK